MLKVNLNEQQMNNLLAFLTRKDGTSITGAEAIEFVNIVNALASAEKVEETQIAPEEITEEE